jgi:branched-chain amino acid transport system permease protein
MSRLEDARALGRTLAPPLGLAAIVYLVILASGDPVLTLVATGMFINLVVVMSLFMFTGLSGLLSFGHIGFMAIGAYVGALLTIPSTTKATLLPDLPGWLQGLEMATVPAALIAGAVAALFALFLAAGLMRLAGLAAGIATLSVLMVVSTVAKNWEAVTRGTGSMLGIPVNTTLTVAFVGAGLAIAAAALLQRSALGLRLRASREDPYAAMASGVNLVRDRSFAFVISAFVAGVAGFLYAQFLGVFGPDSFYIALTFLTLAMLVIGGRTSLFGAVLGTVVVATVTEILDRIEQSSSLTGLQEIGLALVMLAVLVTLPEGLVGLVSRLTRLRERFQPSRPESTPSGPAAEAPRS